jgi:hypothetical protein
MSRYQLMRGFKVGPQLRSRARPQVYAPRVLHRSSGSVGFKSKSRALPESRSWLQRTRTAIDSLRNGLAGFDAPQG